MFDSTLALKLTDTLLGWLDRAEASTETPRAPVRILNPAKLPASAGRLFVLRASPGCELTSYLDGRRFARDAAPVLPMPGCRHANCNCRYEAAGERRRGERRETNERREAIRFEPRDDRRARRERREIGGWSRSTER